jgi:CBS domain-containing protein
MQLRDVKTREVETVRPDGSVEDTAAKTPALGVGPLPGGAGDRVSGMATDRVLAVRATAVARDAARTPVAEVMTADLGPVFEV